MALTCGLIREDAAMRRDTLVVAWPGSLVLASEDAMLLSSALMLA
jgi:hypothetical protein